MGKLSTAKMYLRRTQPLEHATDLYAHRIGLLEGGELDLASHRGAPTLIVNTASRCGFTPQYAGLQALWETYGPRGLNVLGSPSGDFADQELDEAAAIGDFCQRNYGVTFPLTEKVSVRADPVPLWADLSRQPGSGAPNWNFTKYLVGADGRFVQRWGTRVTPEDPSIAAAIEQALDGAAR